MNSKDYWVKREEEALKHYIKDEKEYDKQIQQIYSNMLDNVQKEIDSFYGKYASKEGITLAEAKKRVSKLDIKAYERKAKRYVKDKDFSAKANEEMRLYNLTMKVNRLEMLKANIGLEMIAGHDELDRFMGKILKGRTEEELKRQAGILGETVKSNAKNAQAIPNASFHNATFSDRVWLYQDLMKADLSKLLQSGLIQGKNPRVLARELEKKFDVGRFNAERLMRTELARVQTAAQKLEYEGNGFEQYTFIANSSCCDICKALDGKHFKVKDMMPGENAAPMHPHCRCATAPYSDRKEYEEWLNYLADGGTTEEYNKLKTQGKTPTKAVKPAKTANKAKNVKEEAEKIAKSFGVNADYSKFDISVANALNETMQRAIDEFGLHALDALKSIGTDTKKGREGGFDSFTGKLSLSGVSGKKALFKMGEKTRKANQRYASMGIKYFSAEGDLCVIHHEMGHAIHSSLGGSIDTAATPLDREIISFMRSRSIDTTSQVSFYADKNNQELVAECIAQYFDGSASEITLGIIEILKKHAKNK